MKRLLLFAATMMLGLASCSDNNDPTPQLQPAKDFAVKTYEGVREVGEVWYKDYDEEAGRQFALKYGMPTDPAKAAPGGCSSVRIGDFHARNMDWQYVDNAAMIIHMPAKAGVRYASTGIALTNDLSTQDVINAGVIPDTVYFGNEMITGARNGLAATITDGLNEKGVCISCNVVGKETDRQGYIPTEGVEGKDKVSMINLPRIILDKCASVKEAIEMIKSLNVVEITVGKLTIEDLHFMISDPSETIVVEWYDNQLQIQEYMPDAQGVFRNDKGMAAVMTNAYVCKMKELLYADNGGIRPEYDNGKGGLNAAGYDALILAHRYAMGLERHFTLEFGAGGNSPLYTLPNTLEAAEQRIESVLYSNLFVNEASNWYTENIAFVSHDNGMWTSLFVEGKTFNTALECLVATYASDAMKNDCQNYVSVEHNIRNMEKGIYSSSWYTSNTLVFDTKNLQIHLMPQKGCYSSKSKFGRYLTFGVEK